MRQLISLTLLVLLSGSCSHEEPKTSGATAGGGQAPAVSSPVSIPVAANAEAYLAHVAKLVEQAEANGEATIAGTDGDLLLVKELRSLSAGKFWGAEAQSASRAPKQDRRDPLPAILDYHKKLQAAGIEWVFVPVPAKVAVDPSVVPGAPKVDGRIDVQCVAFYDELRKAGVPVLDVLPALRELLAQGKRSHCKTDTHWTPAACEVVARLLREQVAAQAWYAAAPKVDYVTAPATIEVTGDMAAMRSAATSAESLSLLVVEGSSAAKDSSVLLMGDSHCLVYHSGGDMHAEHAGLPDHLMQQLHMPIDVLGVRGSGATPSRVDAFRGNRFDRKKSMIWCLTAREFTEGQGWALVPVKR